MQIQIDALRQSLQDYNMQTNDLTCQLKQLNLELHLIEIVNSNEEDGMSHQQSELTTCLEEKSRLIQTILSDMKAEITREEADLVGLREINQKLQKEAEQDEVRRFKYEQEVSTSLTIQLLTTFSCSNFKPKSTVKSVTLKIWTATITIIHLMHREKTRSLGT